MARELEPIDHFDQMNKVVEEMLKGHNAKAISTMLGMKPADVNKYILEWQGYARNNSHLQDRARDAVVGADQHYNMVIKRMWETVDEADEAEDMRVKVSALRQVADIEQKRIDMLQKAGLLDNQQLAEQVLETERKQELLIGILREVNSKYPEAAAFVRKELAKVTGQAEATVIQAE